MGLEKRVTRGDVLISRYDDGSFASAREQVTTEIVEDGKVLSGMTVWEPIADLDTFKKQLGEAAVEQREHVDRVEAKILEERASAENEKNQLREQIAKLSNTAAAAGQIIGAVLQADAEWNAKLAPLLKLNGARPPQQAPQTEEAAVSK